MKLLFIYNANTGFLNSALDSAHKFISPKTYNCNLCSLTHGNFKENKLWKSFRESVNIDLEFYHKNEFEQSYNYKTNYPIVLKLEGNQLFTVLSSNDLNQITSTKSLILKLETLIKP